MTNAARALFLFTLLLLTGLATAAPAPSRLSTTRGFEPNRGQFSDTRARYLSRLRGYVVALDGSGASFYRSDGVGARRVRLQLEGSSALAVASGEDSLPAQVNYFLGEDPAAWHTAIPTFARVRVPGVYPFRVGADTLSCDAHHRPAVKTVVTCIGCGWACHFDFGRRA